MTIKRGEQWGAAVPVPDGLVVVHGDGELRELIGVWRTQGGDLPAVGLGGGDLASTVAGGSADQFTAGAQRLPLDLVRVEADGRTTWSAAHVVCRRSWWRGEVVLAMTAQFLGERDVTPRGHPNDGKLDLLRVAPDMSRRARWQAVRRARTGSHLPHPQLHLRQVAAADLMFDRPLDVSVDGRRWLTTDRVRLTVEPDAYVAYV